MIAKLTGRLDHGGPGFAVVDVGGVGYLVFCSARTLRKFEGGTEPVSLLIDTHVREDHIHLYGFGDRAEQAWFRLLITVQGVGAKVALAVLDALAPAELARAIASGDKVMLSRADGVGPKLAGRIAAELKDKAGAIALGQSASAPPAPAAKPAAAASGSPVDLTGDAVSALVNLGYGRAEAFEAVAAVARDLDPAAGLSELIRRCLKRLAPTEMPR